MAVTRINKKQMSELDKEYEASLKSIETENKIDRKKIAGCFLRCGTEKNDVVSRIFMGTVENDSKEVVASPVFTASGPVGCRRGFLYSERFRCGCVVIRHSDHSGILEKQIESMYGN